MVVRSHTTIPHSYPISSLYFSHSCPECLDGFNLKHAWHSFGSEVTKPKCLDETRHLQYLLDEMDELLTWCNLHGECETHMDSEDFLDVFEVPPMVLGCFGAVLDGNVLQLLSLRRRLSKSRWVWLVWIQCWLQPIDEWQLLRIANIAGRLNYWIGWWMVCFFLRCVLQSLEDMCPIDMRETISLDLGDSMWEIALVR